MDENQKAIVAYFENIIADIKDGVLEIPSVSQDRDNVQYYLEDGSGCRAVEGRTLTGAGTITLRYRAITKRKFKSLREIYDELFDEYLENKLSAHDFISDDEEYRQEANIYAIKNTTKVWREQWEK